MNSRLASLEALKSSTEGIPNNDRADVGDGTVVTNANNVDIKAMEHIPMEISKLKVFCDVAFLTAVKEGENHD